MFVATCLYLRLFYNYTNLNGDEGVILQGAQRRLPYGESVPAKRCVKVERESLSIDKLLFEALIARRADAAAAPAPFPAIVTRRSTR